MYSSSSKNLSQNLVPPLSNRLFNSQRSDTSSVTQKKVISQKVVTQRSAINHNNNNRVSKKQSPNSQKNYNINDAKVNKLQGVTKNTYKNKIRQNKEKLMMIKEKYSKILTTSKSTTLSSESELPHRQKAACKDNKKVKFPQSVLQDKQQQVVQKKVTVITENNSNINQNDFIIFKDDLCEQKFKIIRYINEGISGKVYLAQNVSNKCILCIKIIPRIRIDKSQEHQMFRQIKIQSFLNHPNIVKLYHFFIDNQNIYLMLEPCLGNDLYKKIKVAKNGFKEKQVKEIIKQICQAAEYMHKNDVIHRDLKPQNILIHENVVKICDFGWAIHSPLLRDTLCGTPLYSSPEMIKKQLYDSKIDIWSIGVLTYELIYGTIPFQIRQLQDLDKIIQQQIYFSNNDEVSKQAKEFITACTNKNPTLRLNIRQAIEHDFLKNIDKNRLSLV